MKKILLIMFLLSPLQAMAAEEDWYTYWSFGFANHSYPGDIEAFLNIVDAVPGTTRTQIAIDILGFYWPVAEKAILGFVISGTADGYVGGLLGDYQLNQYLYGASIMKFFGKETGDGFFLRGDLGFADANEVVSGSGVTLTHSLDGGMGILFGIGYGIPVSEESRILFSINIHNNDIENENWSAVSFNLGGLW
ncbi:MAG: hypothetical protein OEZ15_03155 [Gammaproteobacteria bacterium]|nr:hypothetical protein [Gammaproteobacteria bacterium]